MAGMTMDGALAVLWEVLTAALIPAAAIVVSTVIAVRLARTERQASEKAREEEREAALNLRDEARRDAALAHEEARRDRVLEELIEVFAFFISAHPTAENWVPMMRLLRARVVVLQTFPTARVLGEWLASENARGMAAMQRAMSNPWAEAPDAPEFLEWSAPLAQWANDMINGIASWMRGDITDEQLRTATARNSDDTARPRKP